MDDFERGDAAEWQAVESRSRPRPPAKPSLNNVRMNAAASRSEMVTSKPPTPPEAPVSSQPTPRTEEDGWLIDLHGQDSAPQSAVFVAPAILTQLPISATTAELNSLTQTQSHWTAPRPDFQPTSWLKSDANYVSQGDNLTPHVAVESNSEFETRVRHGSNSRKAFRPYWHWAGSIPLKTDDIEPQIQTRHDDTFQLIPELARLSTAQQSNEQPSSSSTISTALFQPRGNQADSENTQQLIQDFPVVSTGIAGSGAQGPTGVTAMSPSQSIPQYSAYATPHRRGRMNLGRRPANQQLGTTPLVEMSQRQNSRDNGQQRNERQNALGQDSANLSSSGHRPISLPPLGENRPSAYISSSASQVATPQRPQNPLHNGQVVSRNMRNGRGSRGRPPTLAARPDNRATAEWRNRKGSGHQTYKIPGDINPLGGEERPSDAQVLIPRVADIAAVCGVHVNTICKGGKFELEIYGDQAAAKRAYDMIDEWIKQLNVVTRKNHIWAKTYGYDEKRARKVHRKIQREQVRQRYRQSLKEDDPVPEFCSEFEWPLEYAPRDVMGPNFEALDPIRMDSLCYISCQMGPNITFSLRGNDKTKLEEAISRMKQIPAQLNARAFEPECTYMLEVPELGSLPLPSVTLLPYSKPVPSSKFHRPVEAQLDAIWATPRYSQPLPTTSANPAAATGHPSTAKRLMESVVETMSHLRYNEGAFKMQIRLGTFVATKYRKTERATYPYNKFAEMTTEYQFEAHVSEELGRKDLETQLLSRCFQANGLLKPTGVEAIHLADVEPVYSATFVIEKSAGDLILDVVLSSYKGATQLESKRWSQLGKKEKTPKRFLDANIIDLQDGLAWHVGLEHAKNVSERGLAIDYQEFPESLELDLTAAKDIGGNRDFIIYRTNANRRLGIPIKSICQKRSWRFHVDPKLEWNLEITEFHTTELSGGEPSVRYEPRWSVNVWHSEWANLLEANSAVEIGRPANWAVEDACSLFFPEYHGEHGISDSATINHRVSDNDDSESEETYSRHGDVDDEVAQYCPHDSQDKHELASIKAFSQLVDLLRKVKDMVTGKGVESARVQC
ncbi:uncharacterized protein K452DRAFT_124414 [Aplosporella prunicola CBS 121167]|uniref:DUF7905 domain-containing protein n=1 Tax=Aplosporella prunicola CBS 121167 TaxID=1176127 RepID=A0A6A6BNJ6_9PEZI|nr:uncharacterized protein K452DRAFT_124414 [Aplosporella prunicola CBS 121167]KAF2145719.1 hypothetical protein K452DRAFT_124414 [Aplosporella prunicola CBS 121167]